VMHDIYHLEYNRASIVQSNCPRREVDRGSLLYEGGFEAFVGDRFTLTRTTITSIGRSSSAAAG
jgi:hypothetical protein